MITYADQQQNEKRQDVRVTSQRHANAATVSLANKRQEAMAQMKLQELANNSLQVRQLKAYQALANNSAAVVQCMFKAGGQNFDKPKAHKFTVASALAATEPIPHGQAKKDTGRNADSGVAIGDVGSYQYVQYLEKTGDGLTGDHQPSGAAIKETIREMLHTALLKPLTRSMARNAYKKAITIVMDEFWHRLESRTYGGNNTKAQIIADSQDLATAAMEDWKKTVPELKTEGFSDAGIQQIWKDLCEAREDFFATGNAQVGTL